MPPRTRTELPFQGHLPVRSSHDSTIVLTLDPSGEQTVMLRPKQRLWVPTGLIVHVPIRHTGLILPLDELALDEGVTVLDAPALVSPSSLGEIRVLLYNAGDHIVALRPGQAIARLLVFPAAIGLEPVPVETTKGEV